MVAHEEPAMTQTILPPAPHPDIDEMEGPDEPGLILGRPVEDRGFETVETGIGVAAGIAIGTAVAGPVGTVIGGLVGAGIGLAAGEVVERAAGHAAETTDATNGGSR